MIAYLVDFDPFVVVRISSGNFILTAFAITHLSHVQWVTSFAVVHVLSSAEESPPISLAALIT
jgi:hypothetical protein